MTISGTILIDITIVKEDRHRGRVAAALGTAPRGATVELVIGPLRVTPDAARLMRQYAGDRRLAVCVKGEGYAVRAWVNALRSGELCGVLL